MRACFLAILLAVMAVACGGDVTDPDMPFGETALVTILNPPENDGNTAEPPALATVGVEIGGVDVDVDPGGDAVTDATGLAVIKDLAAGAVNVIIEEGAILPLEIFRSGDLHDAAIAYDGGQAAFYPGFPIRYGVGGEIVEIPTVSDPTQALNTDDTIVFFEDGVHVGNLVIEGENVILFGEGFAEHSVVVDGNVEVRGGQVRIRGVTITGDLTVLVNNFGMSFSVVQGATQLNGQAISFLRNVFCQGANVPSSNAALYANEGLPPFTPADPQTCQ